VLQIVLMNLSQSYGTKEALKIGKPDEEKTW
jgi:hypothetical protein